MPGFAWIQAVTRSPSVSRSRAFVAENTLTKLILSGMGTTSIAAVVGESLPNSRPELRNSVDDAPAEVAHRSESGVVDGGTVLDDALVCLARGSAAREPDESR